MSFISLITGVLFFIILPAGQLQAATCLTGSCHSNLLEARYVHGPIAAEQMGVKGCVACHEPAGRQCSQSKGGAFKPMKPATRMCAICHSRGTGTQHTAKKIDCLKCHDPHGSSKSPELQR